MSRYDALSRRVDHLLAALPTRQGTEWDEVDVSMLPQAERERWRQITALIDGQEIRPLAQLSDAELSELKALAQQVRMG